MFVLKLSCLKVYINMLFTREVINGMFFQQFFYMSQSIVMFVLKLSCPEVYINTLFTQEVISGMFSRIFFHGSKLSWCLYPSYQDQKPILLYYLQKKGY